MNIRNQFSRVTGFTLIELLVVLVILGMLAGLVGPRVMKYAGSSRTEVARVQLEDLAAGLDLFKLDVGRYPNSNEGLQVLIESSGTIPGWNGPYLRKNKLPKDPWGRDYIYSIPGQKNEYDLHTLGQDGKPGGDKENSDLSIWG
ncbi:MAG: type II secretion system major pseudopilin GspG [Gammaproteobacteria bacterium]|nr:type II secretion system major pseudopilin GspG [Gammaproteobacteria bacterium]MDH5652918.1 type II secretion system major pseudopilin GspG [Gammaproteobacteria bacterium]